MQQGSIQGSLVFNIYINNICKRLTVKNLFYKYFREPVPFNLLFISKLEYSSIIWSHYSVQNNILEKYREVFSNIWFAREIFVSIIQLSIGFPQETLCVRFAIETRSRHTFLLTMDLTCIFFYTHRFRMTYFRKYEAHI